MLRFGRIWVIGLIVGAISCVPITLCSDSKPELIGVPILLGTVYIAVTEIRFATRQSRPTRQVSSE